MVITQGIITLQVFLDEVNTSSCAGLFKEILVDNSIDGEVKLISICITH